MPKHKKNTAEMGGVLALSEYNIKWRSSQNMKNVPQRIHSLVKAPYEFPLKEKSLLFAITSLMTSRSAKVSFDSRE